MASSPEWSVRRPYLPSSMMAACPLSLWSVRLEPRPIAAMLRLFDVERVVSIRRFRETGPNPSGQSRRVKFAEAGQTLP